MEKPILFNTEMVQAILEGRKTQTRRIMKLQPKPCNHKEYEDAEWKNKPAQWINDGNDWYCALCGNGIQMSGHSVFHAPYQVGDILWVRETWNNLVDDNGDNWVYKADGGWDELSWHPSIHMPKVAARIFLKVTNVKVQRVQDITLENSLNEGFRSISDFETIWDKLYRNWSENPWVWVIGFERIIKPSN